MARLALGSRPLQPVEVPQLHEITSGFGQTHLAFALLAVIEPIRELDKPLRSSTEEELEANFEASGLNTNAHRERATNQKEARGRVTNRREAPREPARDL